MLIYNYHHAYHHFKQGVAPIGRRDKPQPPSVGHGVRFAVQHVTRFAVAECHLRNPRISSLKSSCTTSYWSSIETIVLNCLVLVERQTNKQTNERTERRRRRVKPALTLQQTIDTNRVGHIQ